MTYLDRSQLEENALGCAAGKVGDAPDTLASSGPASAPCAESVELNRFGGGGRRLCAAKGLLRDLCQQQPGAPNSSSQAREYGQDHDVKASLDSEDDEKAGDQEQDRSDGIG